MTNEYPPQVMEDFFARLDAAVPEWGLVFAGITGNTNHTYGYHRSRNWDKRYSSWSPPPDYSIRHADDQEGDGDAAAAIDMTPRGSSSMSSERAMVIMTSRLVDAIDRRDPRARFIAEIYGTVNGTSVTGRLYGSPATADDTHLWHVHLACRRRYANDAAAWRAIEAIILDRPVEVSPDDPNWSDTVTRDEIVELVRGEILDGLRATLQGGDRGAFTQASMPELVEDTDNGVLDRVRRLENAK